METHLDDNFARVLYESLAIFEATNINKAFLLKEAGTPEALKEAKDRVNNAWESAHMNGIVKGNNILQKLFNFLYLMDIRKPGFTDGNILQKIHDLAIHGSLEQRFLSKVTSDTVPDEAIAMLSDASAGATQAAKPYPELTKAEESVWNRVKVYHEFPDGFKWVYAVDENGRIAPNIPSSITSKTMHHCGNSPRAGSNDEYWELRDSTGKAYLTIILTPVGKIEESKSWGNQENKYRRQIQPYVKWFLKDQKVTGVGYRYDYGYASQMNFGVKDFIGDDPEFIDYVIENKSDLLGNTESRILFWQDAIKEGVLSKEDLKNAYMERTTVSELMDKVPALKEYAERARFKLNSDRFSGSDSIFGSNPFTVICAACSGNPFTPEEIETLVREGTLSLEEFANYDVHMLTPEMQKVFVKAKSSNFDTLCKIAEQVASFSVTPELWISLLPSENEPDPAEMLNRSMKLLNYVYSANPPRKVKEEAEAMIGNDRFGELIREILTSDTTTIRQKYGWYAPANTTLTEKLSTIFERFPDMPIPEKLLEGFRSVMSHGAADDDMMYLDDIERIGSPRNEPLMAVYTDDRIAEFLDLPKTEREYIGYVELKERVNTLIRVFGKDRIVSIASRFPDFVILQGAIYNAVGSDDNLTDSMVRTIRHCINEWGDEDWTSWGMDANNEGQFTTDILLNHPNAMDVLDWKDPSTYQGMGHVAGMLNSPSFEKAGVGSDKVAVYVNRVCKEALDNEDASCQEWSYLNKRGGRNRLPITLSSLMREFSLKPESAGQLYLDMANLMLGDTGKNELGYDTSWFYIPGAWTIFTIPYDEWEHYYGQYGFRFINAYVLHAPADRFVEDDFPAKFVCRKLQDDMDSKDLLVFNEVLGNYNARALKTKMSSVISDAVEKGEFDVPKTKFMTLYNERFINAKGYRAYMERREDRGAMQVTDLETAKGVVNSLRSIAKLPTLPQLITSTVQFLVDTLYDHMGDGDSMYYMRVDKECDAELSTLKKLIFYFLPRPTTGYIPGAIMNLYSSGLVSKMRAFKEANLQACEVPGKPKAKMKCVTSEELEQMVKALDTVKDSAEAAAAKLAEKKVSKPRKKATPA